MSFLVKDGRLTGWGILVMLIAGASFSYFSLVLLPGKLLKVVGLSLGLALMGMAGYSARAAALDAPPPFTNDPLDWRKAKKTYADSAEHKPDEDKRE